MTNQYDDQAGGATPAEETLETSEAQPSDAEAAQQASEEHLAALIDARLQQGLRPILDQHFRGVQQQVSYAQAAVQEVREVLGDSSEALAIVRAFAESQLTPEDFEQLRMKTENARLKKAEEQAKKMPQPPPSQVTGATQEDGNRYYNQNIRPVLETELARWGITEAEAERHLLPKVRNIPLRNIDIPSYQEYARQAIKVIQDFATQKANAAKARATVDTTRGAGSGRSKRVTPGELAKMTPAEYQAARQNMSYFNKG